MLSRLRIGLLPRILLALVLGISLGGFVPEAFVRFFLTLNGLFAHFLDFIIPLIILALVAEAIGSIGHQAGRMLLLTVAIAYGSTIFSGYLAYFTGVSIFPRLIEGAEASTIAAPAEGLQPYFSLELPPVMGVMTALVLAFVLGLASAHLSVPTLRGLIVDMKEVVTKVIETVIVPLLPLYIFGIFLDMASSGKVLGVLLVFIKIIGVIFVLHIGLLLLQYTVAGLVVRRNPLKLLLTMMPAYFTALGTSSSAATIPVTLAGARRNGVSEGISAFVILLLLGLFLLLGILLLMSVRTVFDATGIHIGAGGRGRDIPWPRSRTGLFVKVPGAPAALGVAAGKVQIRHAEGHVIDPAGKAFVLAGLTWSGVSAQALEAKGTAELDRIWEWAVARGYTQETGEYVELNGVLGVQQGLRARQERRQGLNRP